MPNSANKPTSCGNLDLHKLALLKSWGLADDKSVIDCDPIAQTVTFADGRVRQKTEIYSRVMGYHRPVNAWNIGKQQENKDRRLYSLEHID